MSIHRSICIAMLFIFLIPLGLSGASGSTVVLVTGFEPFGVHSINPSQIIAETLNGSSFNDAEIIGIVLPVDFEKSVERARDAIELYHPDVVISLGLNAKAQRIEVEKIGFNIKRYQKDDGTWSFPQRIDKNGPFLRLSYLKTYDIARTIRQANIPAQQSFFAGTYICNSLFYGLLGYVTEENLSITVGFLHVPLLDSQDPSGMPFQKMVDAVKIAIQESIDARLNE
jgi:pyroglutamyl-peptidase